MGLGTWEQHEQGNQVEKSAEMPKHSMSKPKSDAKQRIRDIAKMLRAADRHTAASHDFDTKGYSVQGLPSCRTGER